MHRKLIIVGLAVVVGVLAVTGFAVWSLRQAPDYYTAALAGPSSDERRQDAKRFVQTTLQLVDEIRYEPQWSEVFTEDEVNAWLAEELHQKYPEWLPEGVSQPRVQFNNGVLFLAFQFHRENWGGVINIQLRPWLPHPNELALEIQSARVGLVPVPLDSLLDELTGAFEKMGWRTQWKQSGGNDVLIVDLRGDSEDRPVLEAISLEAGKLTITGSRPATVVQHTAGPPAGRN